MIGKNKIKECFLVDVDFHSESFVLKSIKCLSNFISKEYSAKPWNRCSHFSEFIKSKENMAISLKDHRFNRLQDCCFSLLYHLDDINGYLAENTGILNDMAILDRGFLEMELLKPIYSAIALTGLHITKPFHTLLTDNQTTYSTLMKSFKLLYNDLTSIPAKDFLTTEKVVTFISDDIFKRSGPEDCVLQYLSGCINTYPVEIEKLMTIVLPKFAYGFDYQRGAIFGFGPSAELEPRGGVMKVSTVDDKTLKTLDDNVPVHNLAQERNVGCINYGLSISGKFVPVVFFYLASSKCSFWVFWVWVCISMYVVMGPMHEYECLY